MAQQKSVETRFLLRQKCVVYSFVMQNLPDKLYAVARWSVVALLVLLPIFVIPTDWVVVAQSKGFLIGVVLIFAVVFWVGGSVAEGVMRVPKSALLIVAA